MYEKYKERGGRPVFHPDDLASFTSILTDLYDLASSSDYIRDMRSNEKLGTLLTLLMERKSSNMSTGHLKSPLKCGD